MAFPLPANIQINFRSVLTLLVTGGEFTRWINVLDPQGGFPLPLFSRIRSCLTMKHPKHYIFYSCSCCLTLSMLRGLKLIRVLQRAQNRKSTKAFGFKCSDNLVPTCFSTLQEKGLCTILALEERKTWANQSLNAILAK